MALLALVFGGVVWVAILVTVIMGGGDEELPERRRSWPTMVALGLLLALFAFAPRPERPESEATPASPRPAAEASESAPATALPGGADALIIVALLVAAVTVVAATARPRSRSETIEQASSSQPLRPVLAEVVAILDQDAADPRSAVIAAYAALESALARHRLPRRPWETATEHVGRALPHHPGITGPVHHLASLYEVARFSEHPISAEQRRAAAVALGDALNGMAGTAATAP